MPRVRVLLFGCLMFSFPLLFAACSKTPAGPTPAPTPPVSTQEIEDSAREWLAGLAGMDGNKILKYTCMAQRDALRESQVMGNALSVLMGSLVGMEIEADVSDVKAQALEYTRDRARLQMGGELRVAMGAQAQAFPIGDVWRMVKENDTWRWCGTDSGVMPLSQEAALAEAARSEPTPTQTSIGASKAVTKSVDFDPKETVLIPAGAFQMGCSPDDTECQDDEKPLHTMTLDAYRIDKYEVTNARHKECVEAGGCIPPDSAESETRFIYYGSDEYADYPVVNMNWDQADEFCKWDGGRLPTEAEWEKAKRGSEDTRIYPWGNQPPDASLLNFNENVGDTTAVGSYPTGASPYGVMDMSGNVYEWVNDWYGETWYSASPDENPTGPDSGEVGVLRGGKYGNTIDGQARISFRNQFGKYYSFASYGFRCARSQ